MRNLKITICLFMTLFFLIHNLQAQQWEQLTNVPFGFKHHSNGFGFNGKAYVLQGTDFYETGSNKFWVYDPETDIWTALNDFPGPDRSYAIGDDWDNKYYYGFGEGDELHNDLWVFDPADSTWTELPSCPCNPRIHPSLIAHNNKVYMATGADTNGNTDDFWEYDVETQIWTQKADVPDYKRHHTFHFSIDSFIYVGGGHVDSWHKFDMNTEVWTAIDNYPEGRVAGTQFQYKNMGYALAGDDKFHSEIQEDFTFMRYDALADDWETLDPLPNGSRWAPSSFIIEDDLYFFGGLDENNADDETIIWKYDLSYLEHPNETIVEDTIVEDTITEPPVTSIFDDKATLIQNMVSPNPFKTAISINNDNNYFSNATVNIFDVEGKLILSQKQFDLSKKLHLDYLSNGVYFVEIKDNEKRFTEKVIKY